MSKKEQFNAQNLITKINNFNGEFTNNLKKEIIDAINLLNDRNAELEELISAKDVEIHSKNAIIATQKMNEEIKNSEKNQCEKEEKPLADIIASFVPSFLNQNWSLPDSLIYYITKNPATSKVYKKIVKSCKYFFIKNPIIIVEDISCRDESEWNFDFCKSSDTIFNIKNILSKLWITNSLIVYEDNYWPDFLPPHELSSIIPKLCDANYLCFSDQIIFYKEFLFISSNVEDFYFDKTIVKHQDGTVVAFEKLIEILPKVKRIQYKDGPATSCFSTKTLKNLLKLPQLLHSSCYLWDLPESFDIETLFSYSKVYPYSVSISFRGPISEAYKNRLQEIKSMKIMDIRWDT